MNRRHALIVVALAAMLLGGARSAGAQEFDPSSWELTPNASVEDGTLVIPSDGAAFRPEPWASETLAVTLRYEGAGIIRIAFATSPEGASILTIDEAGRLSLGREADGFEEVAGTAAPVLESGRTATLVIRAGGGTVNIDVDGDTVLTGRHDLPPPSSGGIAIEAGGGRTVTVESVSGSASGEPGSDPEPESGPAPAPTTTAAGTAGGNGDQGLAAVLDDFFSVNASNVDVVEFSVNLALAGLLSFVLSRVYIHWGTALSNRRRFATNFMLISVTTTFIILVVRSSVALSLGLVGALSIVRFRAAIKDPEELAYMFLAIGIGIGLGDNQRLITIIALAAAVVIIMLVKVFHRRQEDFNLHVTVTADRPAGIDLGEVTRTLEPHCRGLRLSRYDETPSGTEAVFLAEFETTGDLLAMREAVRSIAPGLTVSYLDDKGVW